MTVSNLCKWYMYKYKYIYYRDDDSNQPVQVNKPSFLFCFYSCAGSGGASIYQVSKLPI